MVKLINRCAVLALFSFVAACNGDNAPGVSVAGELNVSYSQNELPQYYEAALARASQLSTSPTIVVAICESDAKKLGHTNSALAGYVMHCVENAGME